MRVSSAFSPHTPVLVAPPQTGVDLDKVQLVTDDPDSTVTMREVGAPMLPMWPSYYKAAHRVVVRRAGSRSRPMPSLTFARVSRRVHACSTLWTCRSP